MDKNWLVSLGLPLTILSAPVFSTEYLTVEKAQQILFADADDFIAHFIQLTDTQKDQIKSLSGKRQRWDEQQVWRAEKQGELLGWFIVDNVVGKHEFITYSAAISPQGEVLGIEILTYLETHGDEVRDADWRAHFDGKTLNNKLKLGSDIPNISGATLSCRNITDGIKRLLALQKVALTDG